MDKESVNDQYRYVIKRMTKIKCYMSKLEELRNAIVALNVIARKVKRDIIPRKIVRVHGLHMNTYAAVKTITNFLQFEMNKLMEKFYKLPENHCRYEQLCDDIEELDIMVDVVSADMLSQTLDLIKYQKQVVSPCGSVVKKL